MIEKVVPETDDAATVVIRPGWGWSYDHHPGQYIGIGIQIKGKFHWRSYSVSSPPEREGKTIAITVRAMPEGFLSEHLVSGVAPGTIIRLALPSGDFVLPNPPPPKILFLVGGSGITPVMSMLRTMSRRGTMPDVVLSYSSTTPERMIFRDELKALVEKHPSADAPPAAHRHRRDALARRAPRRALLRLARARGLGLRARADARRRRGVLGEGRPRGASCTSSGSHSTSRATAARAARSRFRNSGKTAEVDGATTVLEAGEGAGVGMPYGCRAGICHTCTVTMVSGKVRDLRNGTEYSDPNENIQTCVTVPVGDCELDI